MWTLAVENGDWNFSNGSAGKTVRGWEWLKQCVLEKLQTLTGTDCMNPNYGSDVELMAASPAPLSALTVSIRKAVASEIKRIQLLYKAHPKGFMQNEVPIEFLVLNVGPREFQIIITTLGGAYEFGYSVKGIAV